MTTTESIETRTLEVPGAVLRYDIRGELGSGPHPALLLAGSPMDASGFRTLAGHFTDRAVVTYDPRGTGRTERTDGAAEYTPQQHADDLRRVIEALGAGPVDVFGSSGGAVNALALVARHPGPVRTLVAHEPPSSQFLPDREIIDAVCDDMRATYYADGMGPAMAKFIALVSLRGELPADHLDRPAPDPAAFGLPAEDDGDRSDPLVGLNIRTCTSYRHDIEALRAARTRIVLAVGEKSEGELAHRGAAALAVALGGRAVCFPGDHSGFLGGEFGMHGEPDAFAAALRTALDG
ncbi:alpha/beta fold hydrolase [Nocardia asteroides]|uniref:alpha/beta fold hydrolase n=1 Tax=Nocardia asteroides TaxID=1824 RepID=UPI001E4DDAE7|nr:alpha/beta hydrolase [Nocardia asteroides]UGT61970.1 alpha/beta hydrolase [Nocardia asteroides]